MIFYWGDSGKVIASFKLVANTVLYLRATQNYNRTCPGNKTGPTCCSKPTYFNFPEKFSDLHKYLKQNNKAERLLDQTNIKSIVYCVKLYLSKDLLCVSLTL